MAEFGPDLRNALLFQGLSDEELTILARQIVPRPFKAGDNLLESGRDAPGIFVIASGLVAAVVTDESGHEREVAALGKGECIGEIALMTGEPCSATVRAVTDGEAQLLHRDSFVELLDRHPGLWQNLGRILSQRLVRTSRQIARPSLTNAVSLLIDAAEDTSGTLAIAVSRSIAAQTGKRVLLVDGRASSGSSASVLLPASSAPSLAGILRDRNLVNGLQPPPSANGNPAVRITTVNGEDEPSLTEEECLTALELVSPVCDLALILGRAEADSRRPLLADRVRSVLALVTENGGGGLPAWLETLFDTPSVLQKLDVALLTGDNYLADPIAGEQLEEIEARLDKTVVRLPFSAEMLMGLTRDQALSGNGIPAPLQKGVGRLARTAARTSVGLALGAGAAKGFAHIGVLQTLEEHHIPIDYIAGCSIGAIVGAMYAGGLSFEEIEERMQGADRKVRRWHLPLRSVWSDAGLKGMLRARDPTARFRDLQTPFAVVATDVTTGREIVIRKGLVWRAVLASASVPGIFPPALVSKRHLVDGGLVNPVPSQTARALGADIVIAVDLMSPSARTHHVPAPAANARTSPRVPNLVEMLWRANEIMQEEVTLRSAATADITIEPRLGRVRWSDFSHRGREFIALGEQAALEKLPELERMLPGANERL
ncbi:MAG TPA: patatin-like phospholipase family protein [Dehalococcoidia bacterium]|nr:patatin-like phospholipase family protein [Dehalococcoidia bacterium]